MNRAIFNPLSRRERVWVRERARVRGRPARRGVSLMEVLISIFVILFGMLSVAALLPVGRFEIAQAMRADRAAACGRAALREVQVRGLLNPALWRNPNLSFVDPPVPPPNGLRMLLGNTAFLSYAIDPYYIARNAPQNPPQAVALPRFPYGAVDNSVYMQRVTLGMVFSPDTAVHQAFFDRIFTWRDDLTYTLPKDGTLRAQIDLTGGTAPIDGNYSWLATVTPIPGLPDGFLQVNPLPNPPTPYWLASSIRKFEVAAVVFHKRDFAIPDSANPKPGERQVGVEFLGAGWAGGDVKLRTFAPTATFINVKRNDWILLCGLVNPPQDNRPVFKWYRIIAVGEPDPSDLGIQRMVTLAGPDWRYYLDGNGIPNPVSGAIFEGVTGVYTETVEVGGP